MIVAVTTCPYMNYTKGDTHDEQWLVLYVQCTRRTQLQGLKSDTRAHTHIHSLIHTFFGAVWTGAVQCNAECVKSVEWDFQYMYQFKTLCDKLRDMLINAC